MVRWLYQGNLIQSFFAFPFLRKEANMAAGNTVAKVVCILGLSAAVVILFILGLGFLAWIYVIRYFKELEEKWY